MAYKIATASSDSKVINQHFGRATQFSIFEVKGNKFEFLEIRNSTSFCNNGEQNYNHK